MTLRTKPGHQVHIHVPQQTGTRRPRRLPEFQRITGNTRRRSTTTRQTSPITLSALRILHRRFCVASNTVTRRICAIEVSESDGVVAIYAFIHGGPGAIKTSVVTGLTGKIEFVIFGVAFALAGSEASEFGVVAICAVVGSTTIASFADNVA